MGFGTGLAKLVVELREHTRYLQRATEWDRGGRPANRLLSGDDIADAKAWVAQQRPKNAPEPTVLHLDFIRASEEEAEGRLSAQRKQLEAMAAAQAERETALHEAEKALKQAADAQRKRASQGRAPLHQPKVRKTLDTTKTFSRAVGIRSMSIFQTYRPISIFAERKACDCYKLDILAQQRVADSLAR